MQITLDGNETRAKAGSEGCVSCFDARAAQFIAEFVNGIEAQDDKLFPEFLPGCHAKRWAKNGIAGFTLKDLRRASLYHLGHYTEFGIQELANHARHANIETTRLYIRRPSEDAPEQDYLDSEA